MSDMLGQLKAKLGEAVPEAELQQKAAIAEEIIALKRQRNAVILVHNYIEAALYHSVADFCGDSLDLSRRAAETDKDVIVFCGVRFMAETAKILSPQKTVLLPTEKGGCSLAESISAADVRALRARFPGVPVVAYINTYADVKAEVDICCTSSNAARVVKSFGDETVIFLPDEYLARNVARETGKHIIFPTSTPRPADSELDFQLIGWQGRCEVHEKFNIADIENARREFPDVLVLAHPECSPEVVEASDFSGSTNAMIQYVKNSPERRFLLLTECAMRDNIAPETPGKDLLTLCSMRCPHMAEVTLENTRDSLKFMRYVIEVPEDIRRRALRSVERMIAV